MKMVYQQPLTPPKFETADSKNIRTLHLMKTCKICPFLPFSSAITLIHAPCPVHSPAPAPVVPHPREVTE